MATKGDIAMSYIIARPWGGACGVGHQMHNWLSGWLLAKRYNLTFVHSPFCGNKTQVQIDEPVEKWEKFLGFGIGEVQEDDLPKNIKRIQLPKVVWDESNWETVTVDHPLFAETILKHKDENVLFECAQDQFVAMNWDLFDSLQLTIKFTHSLFMLSLDNQLSNKYGNISMKTDDDKIVVAIHIRRGDVTQNGRYKVRWVSLSVYLNIMAQILRVVDKNVEFHIFSDSKDIFDFQEVPLMDYPVIFHLWGSNIFETFVDLVKADILVTGQSMFSVLAGHLSSGVVLARPWSPHWSNFPKDNQFIEVEQNGDFDTKRLKELLCT